MADKKEKAEKVCPSCGLKFYDMDEIPDVIHEEEAIDKFDQDFLPLGFHHTHKMGQSPLLTTKLMEARSPYF